MKVIIAGSRTITDPNVVRKVMNILIAGGMEPTEIVCGMARGVDMLGKRWAEANNVVVECYPANWDDYGRKAGMIRNKEMAKYADALVAIWDGSSSGTKHMIEYMKKLNKPTYIYNTKLDSYTIYNV